ncbi:hypothetical protein C7974DRAFT_139120 [Boeremia exigua]|uniref:uncharacterized protein n=1 Tax=Boeremia exigua TaxID=749465 RepID=UPI001E8D4D71|nr:uncharacterized protein C7974DRAFT_139120 [Boeremia exigua]KAH6639803.1 hypothetical protein C7974DRAFT_139120 [Boeremia exigua]
MYRASSRRDQAVQWAQRNARGTDLSLVKTQRGGAARVALWLSRGRHVREHRARLRQFNTVHTVGGGCNDLCASFGTGLEQFDAGNVEIQDCERIQCETVHGKQGCATTPRANSSCGEGSAWQCALWYGMVSHHAEKITPQAREEMHKSSNKAHFSPTCCCEDRVERRHLVIEDSPHNAAIGASTLGLDLLTLCNHCATSRRPS